MRVVFKICFCTFILYFDVFFSTKCVCVMIIIFHFMYVELCRPANYTM